MTFLDLNTDAVRAAGVTVAHLARRSHVDPLRLYRAMNGAGVGWLTPDEQSRLLATVVECGILARARRP
jgi:hypothetical protein